MSIGNVIYNRQLNLDFYAAAGQEILNHCDMVKDRIVNDGRHEDAKQLLQDIKSKCEFIRDTKAWVMANPRA